MQRRNLLIGSASMGALPVLAWAQVPPPAPVVVPPVAAPAVVPPPAPAAVRPAATAIDKSKPYYVFFEGMIDVNSARRLRQELARLVEAGVAEITLVLDSGGGQLDPTMVTYGFIRALPANIHTHAQGLVASAATLLFLAGEQRSADRIARFVFHPTQSLVVAGINSEPQLRERVTSFDMVEDVMAQVYRDRTQISQTEIERFRREMVVYDAEQAKASGVVQTVADLRIPGDDKAKIILLE